MKETKYIIDPESCKTSADEFIQEFIDTVYPAYQKYGITLAEALTMWKLNAIYNRLADMQIDSDGDSSDSWKRT